MRVLVGFRVELLFLVDEVVRLVTEAEELTFLVDVVTLFVDVLVRLVLLEERLAEDEMAPTTSLSRDGRFFTDSLSRVERPLVVKISDSTVALTDRETTAKSGEFCPDRARVKTATQ